MLMEMASCMWQQGHEDLHISSQKSFSKEADQWNCKPHLVGWVGRVPGIVETAREGLH